MAFSSALFTALTIAFEEQVASDTASIPSVPLIATIFGTTPSAASSIYLLFFLLPSPTISVIDSIFPSFMVTDKDKLYSSKSASPSGVHSAVPVYVPS